MHNCLFKNPPSHEDLSEHCTLIFNNNIDLAYTEKSSSQFYSFVVVRIFGKPLKLFIIHNAFKPIMNVKTTLIII